jgi:hypothetical protein
MSSYQLGWWGQSPQRHNFKDDAFVNLRIFARLAARLYALKCFFTGP